MVTLVMMIVITLIVLGFAEIARNEQRSTLDDQLSVQAYYAAESGINDARTIVNAAVSGGSAPASKTICGDQGSYQFNSTGQNAVDNAHGVSYTCVLVDPSPTTLTYNVGYNSTVIPIITGSGSFGTLTLNWKVPAGFTGSASGCYTALASLNLNPVASGTGAWGCNYPMLRVDLLDANGGLSRNNWAAATSTMFFVPFNSNSVGNSVALGVHGTAVPARCGATNCSVSITGLTGTSYYMRVTTLYRTNSFFTVTAGGKAFSGAQATIDSTGKAQDVLRRVLVAVDLTDSNTYAIPSAGITTKDSICKRFTITNNSYAVYNDFSAGDDSPNSPSSLCTQQTVGSPTNP